MPVNFPKKKSLDLCQDKVQGAIGWLLEHNFDKPSSYFHDNVKILTKDTPFKLKEIADRIYDYVINCVQKKECEIGSILNLTEIRFTGLEQLARDDCTKKMLSDRLADIRGRLYMFRKKGLSKNKSPASVTQALNRIAETSSSIPSTWSTAKVASAALVTERTEFILNQTVWSWNQTSGTYLAEEAPQWNTTANADSIVIEAYAINYPAYVGASIHGLVGGTLASVTERLGERLAEQYPTQRSALTGLMKGFYLMGMASFPVLYASLESSFLQLDPSQTKESLQSSLFTFISSVFLQLMVEKAQQNGLDQSQIRRIVGNFIPLLACGWVFYSAEKPVSALIAWVLNLGAHILSYAAWTYCVPTRSLTCAANRQQKSEAPPFQAVTTIAASEANLTYVGTVHERYLRKQERMKACPLPPSARPLPPLETPAKILEPIYSEINESNSKLNRLGVENKDLTTQEEISEAGYIKMGTIQERNPVSLSYLSSSLYAVPNKKPKPVQLDISEQSEENTYVFKA